ncbi:phosphotransferase enzyme family protein [Saccharomonospora xinjiangensis]|uniref:phosphotransferase enzyme family protein n=1 Tax=Saccharomonospora xinjiangensis TaxID=75294 RepID=UPI00350EC9E4
MSDIDVAGALGEHFALDVREVVPIGEGTDRAATVWKVQVPSGRAYAVKWTSGGSPAGLVLSSVLAAVRPDGAPASATRGAPVPEPDGAPAPEPDGAPAPVRTRAGALWATVAGRRLSVVEWLPGRSAAESAPTSEHWGAFGRLLSALHGLPLDDELRRWLPREDFDPSRWAAAFDRVDAALDRAPDRGEDSCLTRLAALWRQRRDDLRGVRERTVRAGRSLSARAGDVRIVPCHGDAHVGNLVLTGADTVALLDFDDCVLAPPERDLMFVLGGGVFPGRLVTPEQQNAFLRGYGAHATDDRLLSYYRGLRVLEDVADPAAVVLDTTAAQAQRSDNLGYVAATLAPGGLLDQALGVG